MSEQRPNETDAQEIGQSVPLPVLDSQQSPKQCGSGGCAPKMGRTKTGKYRAMVLIAVNVLMIAHLIQWAIMGSTISPIEPSEAMETLEVGVINAGAILFLLAFLSTLIFGRFFCGWLCHIVALQDACAFLMVKMGIRPKPFRSRLLVYFPFGLGMYMFVWPTFKRLVLAPALASASIDWPVWLKPVEPISHYSTALIVDDFWATMPPWYIAVIFLIICGFAAVYFLGAKGFCTYGCPYAAFFKPMDKVAPVRIHVNDDCHQCGYCTSVCTSNVRVSEEVRDFGMVVDAGCMKTLDCISACPNDALSLKLGKPALFAKARSPETRRKAKEKRGRRFDMTLGEELVASVMMLWFFYATRGMLDAIPMLMAGGLAAIAVMFLMTSVKLLRTQNLRLYSFTLKSKGTIKPAGGLILLITLVFIIGSVWSGQAKIMRWRGDMLYAKTPIPTNVLLRPDFQASPSQYRDAQRAIWLYQRGDSFANGGMGWNLHPEYRLRESYFLAMSKQYGEAYEQLLRVVDEGKPTDQLVIQAGQLLLLSMDADAPDDVDRQAYEARKRERLLAFYEHALALHPELHAIRTELARSAYSVQDVEKADGYWETDAFADDPAFYLAQAGYTGFAGQMQRTKELYQVAHDKALLLDRPAGMLIDIGRSAIAFRMTDEALDMAQQAIENESATALTWLAAGELANASGEGELGTQRAEHALEMPGIERPMVQARAAGVLAKPGNTDRARLLLADAATRSDDPFEKIFIAQGMSYAGASLDDSEMLEQGLAFYQDTTRQYPEFSVIGHDYSSLLYSMGRYAQAADEMARVAELDDRNVLYARRASDLYRAIGNEEKAGLWNQEADHREQLSKQDD
ncbi:MAG: 4Fe-4S binding protein [Phycisphaerales bacterium]